MLTPPSLQTEKRDSFVATQESALGQDSAPEQDSAPRQESAAGQESGLRQESVSRIREECLKNVGEGSEPIWREAPEVIHARQVGVPVVERRLMVWKGSEIFV